jgi:putative sterol carrier protein
MRRRFAEILATIFRRAVAASPDQRLERVMRSWLRRPLLGSIFRAAPSLFRSEAAAGLKVVIEVRVGGRRDGGSDSWQLVVAEGSCRSTTRHEIQAPITVEFEPVAFLRFAAGIHNAPDLFMRGKLKVSGDFTQAARLPALFAIPGP